MPSCRLLKTILENQIFQHQRTVHGNAGHIFTAQHTAAIANFTSLTGSLLQSADEIRAAISQWRGKREVAIDLINPLMQLDYFRK